MSNPRNLVLIVLAFGLFYTFGSPQYREVKALQVSANEYKNVIENVSRIAEARDALLIEYENIPPSEREKLLKVLPNNVDSVRLALDLDTIAGRYGVSIKGVAVERADPNAALAVLEDNSVPYQKALVKFNFVSNYENFLRFMTDLEKSLRIMDVKSVSFRVAENGLYDHQVQVETYWLK